MTAVRSGDEWDIREAGCARLLAGDCGEAAFVEVEQLADLVFGLMRGGGDESSGWGAGLGDLSGGGDEFEQIERDIFVAPGSGCGLLFHAFLQRDVNRMWLVDAHPGCGQERGKAEEIDSLGDVLRVI